MNRLAGIGSRAGMVSTLSARLLYPWIAGEAVAPPRFSASCHGWTPAAQQAPSAVASGDNAGHNCDRYRSDEINPAIADFFVNLAGRLMHAPGLVW